MPGQIPSRDAIQQSSVLMLTVALCLSVACQRPDDASTTVIIGPPNDSDTTRDLGTRTHTKAIRVPQTSSSQTRHVRTANTVQIVCDGILHQVGSDQFSRWAEQMRDSKIEQVQLAMPYNPHAVQGIEIWRLSRWPTLRHLDLSEFRGRNVVATGPGSSTTAGAVRTFSAVTELWLYYDLSPGVGDFPSLEAVYVDARNPDADDWAQKRYPDAIVNYYRSSRLAVRRPLPFRFTAQVESATESRSIHLSRSTERDIYAALQSLDALERLKISKDEQLSDLSPLPPCELLTHLDLVDCPNLNDLGELERFPRLRHLGLLDCPAIIDKQLFSSLAQLHSLDLGWCPGLKDLSTLASIRGLTDLRLSGFQGADYSELTSVPVLESLVVNHDVGLTNLSAFHSLTNLKRLVLINCPLISRVQIQELQTTLPNCAIQFDFRIEPNGG